MTEILPTILTGSAPARKPVMVDPRDVHCVGRKRYVVGPAVTLESLADPGALWPLAAAGDIARGEVIDIVKDGPFGFLLALRIARIDHEAQQVLVNVLEERDLAEAD